LGVDELSVNPAFYAEIIEFIRNIKYSDAKELVDKILSLSTANEVSESVNSFYNSEIKPYLN
jgi:phosphoenolpyruvate-protein kinase (PTS system EI component)